MQGILNLSKPGGVTSRHVVNHVVRLVRPAKVGHAGTLDPLATGVLIVCIGGATRLMSEIQSQSKEYRAAFELGVISNTDDSTGQVVCVEHARLPSLAEIESELPRLTGEIQQVPPQFSAVHVGGRRAYDLARRGVETKLSARPVVVHRLSVLAYAPPRLEMQIVCGSGTYIRSLGRDLGAALGCGAVMTALVRTRIGPFRLADSVDPETLTADSMATHLLPPVAGVGHLSHHHCSPEELKAITTGRSINWNDADLAAPSQRWALLTPGGDLAAIGQLRPGERKMVPEIVFPNAGCV